MNPLTAENKQCCRICGLWLPVDDYAVRENGKRRSECLKCGLEYQRQYYQRNREKILNDKRIYATRNHARIIKYQREYHARPATIERHKRYKEENKERLRRLQKEWIRNNLNKYRDTQRQADLRRRKRSGDNRQSYFTAHEREKRRSDPRHRLRVNLSRRINLALRDQYTDKCQSLIDLIGCSVSILRKHIERQFTERMSWNNYGQWHVDHIVPCANFDLTDPVQQKMCFNYMNLQPLWADDNLKKGSKLSNKRLQAIGAKARLQPEP